MRWRYQPATEWHRWFAWYPVVIEGQWVWLETVERRLVESLTDYWTYQ